MARIKVNATRITMFFDDGGPGWRESHLYTGSAVLFPDPTLVAAVTKLATARCYALDARYATLADIVSSVDYIDRDSRRAPPGVIPVPITNEQGLTYPGGPTTQHIRWTWLSPQSAWPVRMTIAGNPTSHPVIYLSGVGQSSLQKGPNPLRDNTNGATASILSSYAKVLCNGDWGFPGYSWLTAGVPNAITPLTAEPVWAPADGVTPNTLLFEMAALPPGLNYNSIIRLQGAYYSAAQNRLRLNNTYPILGIDAVNHRILVNASRVRAAPNWVENALGGIQVASNPSVQAYSSFNLGNLTHRKRGKQSDIPRGRK